MANNPNNPTAGASSCCLINPNATVLMPLDNNPTKESDGNYESQPEWEELLKEFAKVKISKTKSERNEAAGKIPNEHLTTNFDKPTAKDYELMHENTMIVMPEVKNIELI